MRPAALLAAALACAPAFAAEFPLMTAEEEARALIGLEVGPYYEGVPFAENLSCTFQGGFPVILRQKEHEEWHDTLATCRGRFVVMLQKFVGNRKEGKLRWRTIDAVALPPVPLYFEEHPDGRYLYHSTTEVCKLDGRYGTSVYAIVREGKHEWITWRNGIEQAWAFDLKQGRIVSISPKRVVCQRADRED